MSRAISVLLLAGVLLLFEQPVAAGTQASTITDPVADAFFNLNFNSPLAAPGYQDIVQASVNLEDGQFTFALGMAAAVPGNPDLAPGVKFFEWSWRIDTNPATFPSGVPWPPGITAPADYMVFVVWDGVAFTATLIDRTPTLTGGATQITSVPLSIKGAELTASVGASRLGEPSGFKWFAATQLWFADLGTEGYVPLDIALAPGGVWASWPG